MADKTFTQEEHEAALKKVKDGFLEDLRGEREKRKASDAELEKIKGSLKKLEDDANKVKADAEKAVLEGKGDFDALLEAHTKESQAEIDTLRKVIDERDGAIKELKGTVSKHVVDNEILKHAGNAVNAEQVVSLIKAGYTITNEDDGTIKILDASGGPVMDDDGKARNIEH